jgi:hypothetical protein
MRSFADYRKKELKKTIHSLSFSECMSNSFDILRLDLLEAVRLPELLFENSLVTNSIYESARKGDYEDNKQIIDFLVHQCKCGFYQEIIKEANEPNLLIVQVKELIQSLRDSIGVALKASRPVGSGSGEDISGLDPSYDSEKGYAGAANWDAEQKKNKWTSRHSSPPPEEYDDEQDFSADDGSQNQNPVQGFSNYLQQNRRPQQSPAPSFQPGQSSGQPQPQPQSQGLGIRPKDGYWAGIKRSMIDPAKDWIKSKWQNFKRRWHNQGLGEHSSLLENVMLENFDSIMDILDKFEVDLLAIINKIPPTSASVPGSPSDTGPVNPRGSAPAVASNLPASTDAATNDKNAADVLNSIPDGIDVNAKETPLNKTEQVKEDNIIKGAIKGAAALGINLNVGNRIRTSSKVRPENFLGQDGKPIGSGYKSVVLAIANLIKDKIEPEFEKEYRAKKSQEKNRNYNQLTKTDLLPLTLQWLNLPKSGLKNLSVSMLDFYNRKITGQTEKLNSYSPGNATEPMGTDASVPAAGNVTEPMGSNAPVSATGNATEPMGSNAPVSATGNATEPMGSNAPVSATGNATEPMGSNAPVTGRPKKSKQSKAAIALDLLKKNNSEFLDFYLNQVLKGDEGKLLSSLSKDEYLNHEEVSPEDFVKELINAFKQEYESHKLNSAKNANVAPSDAPESNVAPEQVPQTKSARNLIQNILSANELDVDLSNIDDKTLETIVGNDDSSTEEGEENIMSRLSGVLESPNESESEANPPQSNSSSEQAPIEPKPEEVVKSQPKLRGRAGKLAKAIENGANPNLEVPQEVKKEEPPLDQEAVNVANDKLSRTEGYGALERDYRKFISDNEDRDEDEAWDEMNNKILKHVIAGKDPKDVIKAGRVTLQRKIKEIDDKEAKKTTGNFNSDGKDPAAGWKNGKVLNDKNMKKEGFNRVLNKFRQLIHS